MNRLDRFKNSTFSVAILCILLISLFFGYVSCTCSGGYVSYNCYGNILPCNGMYNLGSPTSYWDTIYVNHIVGWASPLGGNVTSIAGGTVGTIPKFTSATNIENSSVTEAQVAGAVTNSHVQNTDTILHGSGVPHLFDAGYLDDDLRTDRWLHSDTNTFMGVGVAGDGNLAHTAGSEGYDNTAFGYHALESITTSYFNSAFGYYSLKALTTGLYNTGFGMMTLTDVTTGNYNTAVGIQALTKTTGSYNTAIGLFAGSTNVVGDGNVFIGASAGQNELGSNKLYIANSNDATPLIYGDFSTNKVTINNDLDVAGNIGVTGTVDGVDISTIGGASHTQGTDTALGVLGTKNPPIDADKVIHRDSTAGDSLVTSTWLQIKAFLKTYFDGVYATLGAGTGNVTTITGGTANKIPKFTAASNIENSSITDSGTIVTMSSNVTMGANAINNLATPTQATDAANKSYVDSKVSTGNMTTITGGTVNKIPKFSSSTNIENSSVTDSGTIVTMSTNMTMSANTINSVADPTQAQDAATKNYADTKIPKSIVTEQGSLITSSGASTPTELTHGTAGQVLQTNGDGANPSWKGSISCGVTNSGGQYIPTGAWTPLFWDTTRWDYDNMHDDTSTVIEDCEDAWNEYSDVNVTPATDAVTYKVGTKSAKFTVGAGLGANSRVGTEAIASTDLSSYTSLTFWFLTTVAFAAGDWQILLDDTAQCASPVEAINMPACPVGAWQFINVPLANPASDTAIISVGLKQVVDKGALTCYIDDVRATKTIDRITIQTTGLYQVSTVVGIGFHATGSRWCRVSLNGLGNDIMNTSVYPIQLTYGVQFSTTTIYPLSAGDYLQVGMYQDSGTFLQVTKSAGANVSSPEFRLVLLK